MSQKQKTIAYFSMEFAFHNDMPNYAGGLGVLAADMMYSCADTEIPIIGVTLFYHQNDNTTEAFPINRYLTDTHKTISVRIENRDVTVSIWKMNITNANGHIVPILFLSTHTSKNKSWDRDITKNLYASDEYTRICQEVVLGIGGIRALKALGYNDITHYHMNEGHSAFLTLELLHHFHGDISAVKKMCTFTTHTPVAAGFDRFSLSMLRQVLTDFLPHDLSPYISDERLGMARMGITLSNATNSVSKKHQEICRTIFPSFAFQNITNGIYHRRWIGSAMKKLYNQYLPHWEQKPEIFSDAPTLLPHDALSDARNTEKEELCTWINKHTEFFAFDDVEPSDYFNTNILTIGFARRYVPYKRHELIFHDLEKLRTIGDGKLQIVFAGRCNPADLFCNNTRVTLYDYARTLRGHVKIIIVPDYDLDIAHKLISGVDVWLNTPVPPREASGTSGMKAALNGVLNLSVADGWWIEGFNAAPRAGWSFAGAEATNNNYLNQHDAYELLLQLEDVIDCYYNHPDIWLDRVTHAISLLATFNTHRVVREYQQKMWS